MLDRALGALAGLAVGDALGAPTKGMTAAAICAELGEELLRLRAGAL